MADLWDGLLHLSTSKCVCIASSDLDGSFQGHTCKPFADGKRPIIKTLRVVAAIRKRQRGILVMEIDAVVVDMNGTIIAAQKWVYHMLIWVHEGCSTWIMKTNKLAQYVDLDTVNKSNYRILPS